MTAGAVPGACAWVGGIISASAGHTPAGNGKCEIYFVDSVLYLIIGEFDSWILKII